MFLYCKDSPNALQRKIQGHSLLLIPFTTYSLYIYSLLLPPTPHYLLLLQFTPYIYLTPYSLLLTTYSLPLTPYSLLLTTYYLLLTTYYLLLPP